MDNVLSGMVSVVDTHLSFRDAEYDAARHFTEDLERRLEAIDAEVSDLSILSACGSHGDSRHRFHVFLRLLSSVLI